ncbi:MAG: fumarylacetoacetate hydrolase family protein [Pseudomonadales bacterium]
MNYQHRFTDSKDCALPIGKAVCVGRNYADHARELNNPVPSAPLLFIKPSTALVSLEAGFSLPTGKGEVQHELEMALLIGHTLSDASARECLQAIVGVGLALDLTLREVQQSLKDKSHPWEISKAFDGSCPCSEFVEPAQLGDLQNIDLQMNINGEIRQRGNTRDMLFPIAGLLATMSQHFTLLPGDIVLTGTPAGVGPLRSGDQLELSLGQSQRFASVVQ